MRQSHLEYDLSTSRAVVLTNLLTKARILFLQPLALFPAQLLSKFTVPCMYVSHVFKTDIIHDMTTRTTRECVQPSIHVTDPDLG